MEKIKIDEYLSTGNVDSIGRVFASKGKIFRGIYSNSVNVVLDLINSGLINQLSNNNLFPSTKITNYHTKDFPLILEHQRIEPISYSQEWSFEMLKDAALTTLKVNKIANKFGYQTIDAHFGNIIFDYTQPKFTDLGSFIKLEKPGAWRASEQFLRAFYYPLSLWSSGYEIIASRLLIRGGIQISHSEYRKILNHTYRIIPKNIHSKLLNTYFPLTRINSIPEELIKNRVHPYIFQVFKFAKKLNLLPFQKFNTSKYINKISIMKSPSFSYWKGYYKSKTYIPKRFEKIAKIVKDKNIKEIVDLAGNNGAFSRLLFQKRYIKKAVCIDYDKGAIDELYLTAKKNREKIVPVVQDVFLPYLAKSNETLNNRFKSDAAVMLGVTHHLLLTQYIQIDKILSTIAGFSKQYIFIEFMPLGLWNGHYAPPVPEWYNQKWFEDKLSKYCLIEKIIPLEKNRILFMGKVK